MSERREEDEIEYKCWGLVLDSIITCDKCHIKDECPASRDGQKCLREISLANHLQSDIIRECSNIKNMSQHVMLWMFVSNCVRRNRLETFLATLDPLERDYDRISKLIISIDKIMSKQLSDLGITKKRLENVKSSEVINITDIAKKAREGKKNGS